MPYMVTFTINIPPMLAYIPAPWILWVSFFRWRESLSDSPRKGGKGAKGAPGSAAPAEPAPGTRLVCFDSLDLLGCNQILTDWNRLIQIQKKGPTCLGQGEPGWADISRFDKMAWWILSFKASFRGEARGFKKFLLKLDDLWKNTTHCWILWCILRTNANNGTLSRHLITTCSRQKLTANAIV